MGRLRHFAALCGLGLTTSLITVGLSGSPAIAADAVVRVAHPWPTPQFQPYLDLCPDFTGTGGDSNVIAAPPTPAPPSGPDALALTQDAAGDSVNWYYAYDGGIYDLNEHSSLDVYDPAGGALLYFRVDFHYENFPLTMVISRPVDATGGWKHLDIYDQAAEWTGYVYDETGVYQPPEQGVLSYFDNVLRDVDVDGSRVGVMRPGPANGCVPTTSPAGTTYIDNAVISDWNDVAIAYDFESTGGGHQDVAITTWPPGVRPLDPAFDLACQGLSPGTTRVEPVTDPLLGTHAARFHTSGANQGAGLVLDLGLLDSLDDLVRLETGLRDPDGASVVELGVGLADASHTVYDYTLRYYPAAPSTWEQLDLLTLDYAWLDPHGSPVAGTPGTLAEFVAATTASGDLSLAHMEMRVARAPCLRPGSAGAGDVWFDGLTSQRPGDLNITWDLESSAVLPVPVVTAKASPATVVGRRATTLTATVKDHGTTPMAGVGLTLQARPHGSSGWKKVGTATTDARGTARRSVLPKKQTTYRWVVTADHSRTSTPVTVRVRPVIALDRVRVKHGRRLVVSGFIKPVPAGAVLTIKSGRKKLGTAKVRANGTFTRTVKVHRAGRYRIVVRLPAGAGLLAAITVVRKVRVR